MSGNKPYRVVRWQSGCDWCDYYDMLKGPDGFECLLTEPEDRCWSRDGKGVVKRLNEQAAEIARLRAALTAIRDRGKGIGGAVVVTETMLRKIAAQALAASAAGGDDCRQRKVDDGTN